MAKDAAADGHAHVGRRVDRREIEAHFCKSPFVREVCLTEQLYAVVVPNMSLMRERKIVNIGDLLRFELEGLTHELPADRRPIGYHICFEELPRVADAINRPEVERRLADRAGASAREEDLQWLSEPHVAAAVPTIKARAKTGRIWPEANLEIDLGFDSMERVELILALEQQFATRIPPEKTAEILTVRQLVDVLRSAEPRLVTADPIDPTWATILGDLPSGNDRRLGWLLRRRIIAAPLLFVILRIVGALLVRARVTGLDRLPRSGPYIITPNHQSYVDPFILCGVLPYRVFKQLFFVGAVEYFETPFTRWVAHTANLVPVDPDSNLISAMQAGAFGLVHGKILLLFPEGERSIDGAVKNFKKGAPILAQHLGVPAVPVALKGIHELWPRNRAINWRLLLPWSGHRVTIAIGEPIAFAADSRAADNASRLRDRVTAMWEAPSS